MCTVLREWTPCNRAVAPRLGPMSEGTRITRTVDTDLDTDELWGLIADGAAWAHWMVDESHVEVAPGGAGTVVDDGVERAVRIDRLDAHRLGFTETYRAASAVTASAAWDVRLMLLVAQALAVHV